MLPVKFRFTAVSAAAAAALLAGCAPAFEANPSRSALSDEGMAMLDELALDPASADEFTARCDKALDLAGRMLGELETRTAPAGAGDLKDFDAMTDVAAAIGYGEAAIMAEANPDAAIREAGDACQQKTSDMLTQVSLSRPVYDRLSSIDAKKLDARSAYLLQRTLRDYRHAGVDKDEPVREKIRTLNAEISEFSTEFSKNLREIQGNIKVAPEDLVGLPDDYVAAHPPGDDGLVTITTDYPDIFPVFTYSPNEALRKELREAALNRAYPENVDALRGLLEKRYDLATTLGYKNWAAYVTEDKMTGSPQVAEDFLKEVEGAARNSADVEYDRLLAKQQEIDPDATSVSDWSASYLSELIRQSDYNLDSQEVRKYFAFTDVRAGIFELVQDLFDVQIEPWENAPVWADDVTAHEMYKDGKLVGRFFLDMHPRDGKFKHAASFPIRFGPTSDGVPVAALLCNFPSGGHETGLMEHDQVETFLHEFGHLIHGMFSGQPDYAALAMDNLEWDFIEAPSQMLENWVWDYDTLAKFAKDADGNTIPRDLVDRMVAARDFGIGLGTLRQLLYANVSLDYYNRPPSDVDFDAIWNSYQSDLSPFDTLPDTHQYANFGHLDGYSAIYYTYQWSLAIATDMFSRFEENGLRDKPTAAHYRDSVLVPGSSKPAADLVHDFLGRDWTPQAYEDHLVNAAESGEADDGDLE
ncbi:MAG: M3 family metallopeptidase [Hyphomonas sp.]|nr:Zn-dependent oligopeptidase [Hyphomonas sp.]